MLPFNEVIQISGQLVQIAEAFEENDSIGKGRQATDSKIFMAVPSDSKNEISFRNLYQTENGDCFYFHQWD